MKNTTVKVAKPEGLTVLELCRILHISGVRSPPLLRNGFEPMLTMDSNLATSKRPTRNAILSKLNEFSDLQESPVTAFEISISNLAQNVNNLTNHRAVSIDSTKQSVKVVGLLV